MIEADHLLEDEELIGQAFEAQGKRHEHRATKGRSQTPAGMVLRLLLLKHVRNWSFDGLEREVRMNLAYRDFVRIGLGKCRTQDPGADCASSQVQDELLRSKV